MDRIAAALGDVDLPARLARATSGDLTTLLLAVVAARQRDSTARRSDGPQDLATLQRITRAQRFDAPEAFVHFSIAALVTAGRSRPDDGFDADALLRHLDVHLSALAGLADRIEIVLSTQDTGPGRNLLASIGGSLVGRHNVRLAEDPDRIEEQGYYRRACFKINVDVSGSTFEVGDGGFTDWTERLLDDRRERLLTSALGLDRLALAMGTR